MKYDPYGDLRYFEPFEAPFRVQSNFKWVEIKECAWCGEKDIIVTFDNIEENENKIICPICRCYFQDYTLTYLKFYRKIMVKRWFKNLLGI